MQKDLLTTEQAAREAGVQRSTLQLWVARGWLKPVAIRGKRHLYTRGAITSIRQGVCELCGALFERFKVTQRFCSDACRKTAHRLERKGVPVPNPTTPDTTLPMDAAPQNFESAKASDYESD